MEMKYGGIQEIPVKDIINLSDVRKPTSLKKLNIIKNICMALKFEEVRGVDHVVYIFKNNCWVKIGNKYVSSDKLKTPNHLSMGNRCATTMLQFNSGNNADIKGMAYIHKPSPKMLQTLIDENYSNGIFHKSNGIFHKSNGTKKEFMKINMIVGFQTHPNTDKAYRSEEILFSIKPLKKILTFLTYAYHIWSKSLLTYITSKNIIMSDFEATKLIPYFDPALTNLIDYLDNTINATCVYHTYEGEKEIDHLIDLSIHDFHVTKNSKAIYNGVVAKLPILDSEYDRVDRLLFVRLEDHIKHFDSNYKNFTKEPKDYHFVVIIEYDKKIHYLLMDDLRIPELIDELVLGNKKWFDEVFIKSLSKSIVENDINMVYYNSEEREKERTDNELQNTFEELKIKQIMEKKEQEKLKLKQKQQLLIKQKQKLRDKNSVEHSLIRHSLKRLKYFSTTEKVVRMIACNERKLGIPKPVAPVFAQIPAIFSPIYTVRPSKLLPNPFSIPRGQINSNDPSRIGTSRVLSGVQNIMVIYPKGAEYPGRLKYTICGRVVIEPSEPDTAAFICWAKDIVGMNDIYLKDIDNIERIYHTEKGYAILNNFTYI